MKRLLTLCALLVAIPVLAQEPATGFPPFGSFANGRFDAVNRANLDVNFAIPIVAVPGRGLAFSHAIVYDSLIWMRSGNTWVPVVDAAGNPTWGWKKDFVIGTVKSQTHTDQCYYPDGEPGGIQKTYSNYSYTDPAGTRHEFPGVYALSPACDMDWDGSFEGAASDKSGYTLVLTVISGDPTPPTATVYSPSGIKITDRMTDPNGNYISGSTVGSVTTWTDTVGREVLKVTKKTGSANCGTGYAECIEYEYKDTGGTARVIKLYLKSYNIRTNFACSGVTEYNQSGKNLPDKLDIPNGPSTFFTYTFTYEDTPGYSGYKSGRLKRVTLPTSGYYEYTYPTSGNRGIDCASGTGTSLTRVINDGTSVTWTFGRTFVSPNWKTTVGAPTGDVSTYTFNSSGQLTSQKYYQGAEQSQNLKRTINTTWATNGTPASTTVIPDTGQQTYTETDFGSTGLLFEVREYALGSGSPWTLVRKTTNTYTTIGYMVRQTKTEIRDGAGTVKARTDIAYDESTYSNVDCPTGVPHHDDSGYGCSFYNRGNPTTVTTYTNAAVPSGAIARHSYYDWFGNVRKADVNCCQQKEFIYSTTTQYAYPDSVKSGPPTGSQYIASATYNSYTGLVVSGTNEQGRTTQLAYDLLKRLTSVTRPDNQLVTYTYDDANRIVTVESPLDGTSRVRQRTYFDVLGRPFKSQVSDSDDGNCSETQAQYDNLGRAYKQSNPITCGDGVSNWTQTAFDALGRVLSVTAPDNSVTNYSYTGATVTITDPSGKARKTESDALGRMVKVYEPDVNNNNALTQETSYAYNVLDLLTGVTQDSQTRSYQYDDMGRLTQQTTPEAGTWQYQYNAFNQITARTDARGVITNYTYDTLNRLSTVTYDVGTTGVPDAADVTYTYGAPNDSNQDKRGRLVSVTDGVGSEGYAYDNLGRVTQFQKVISGTTYTTTYGYNLAGEMISITYPSGRVVSQSYNAIGRLTAMEGTFNSQVTKYVNTFQYDTATGLVTSFKYGDNAVDAAFTYSSDRLQLSTLSYKKVGDQNPFLNLAYSYGAAGSNNGQITGITDNVDSGRSVVYTYDALYRLKIAETTGSANFPKWGLQWTYDRYGNRTAQGTYSGCQTPMLCPTSSFAVSTTTNRITDTGYSYDANGNMTADGRNALAYDAENRLVTNTYQGATTAYAHDGASLRVKKCAPNCTNPTTTTVYVFSGAKVIAEYENGAAVGSPTREYIYSGGALIATHEASGVKFHYRDHLSMRVTSDATGGNRVEQNHFPFGEVWYESAGASKWKFTSYERDAESLNDYAIFRTYINRLGRFNQPDPVSGSIANPQSLNRYAYVLNDPVNLTDPSGLWPFYVSLGDNVVLRPGGDGGAGRGWQIPDTWSVLAVAWSSLVYHPSQVFWNPGLDKWGNEGGFWDETVPYWELQFASLGIAYPIGPQGEGGGLGGIKSAIAKLLNNPNCARWLGGSDNGQRILNGLAALVDLSTGSGTIAGTSTQRAAQPILNDRNALAFGDSRPGTSGGWNGQPFGVLVGPDFNEQSLSAQVTIVFHELIHVAQKGAPLNDFIDINDGLASAHWIHRDCGTDVPNWEKWKVPEQ